MNIGTIIQWGSDTLPDGWLLCDGSAVSRTDYADLFSVIGTNFGSGNGSTTFNLPDLRGKVGVGKSSDTEFDTLGETGGEKTHTLTTDEMPRHKHQVYVNYNTGVTGSGSYYPTNYVTTASSYVDNNLCEYAGSGQSHNNLQPYIVTNYIIKALIPDTVKISELDSASSIDGTELLPIVQSGVTKKITASTLLQTPSEEYSTNEVQTNKVWIDGKPIYRKVLEFNNLSSGLNEKTHGISNIDKVVSMDGFFPISSNVYWLGSYESSTSYVTKQYAGRTKVAFNIGSGWSNSFSSVTIILEYTKTTD